MSNQTNYGWFVPSTPTLEITEINDKNLKALVAQLYQSINQLSMAINGKVSGIYNTDEFVTGKVFPPKSGSIDMRPVFGRLFSFGALPNNTTKSIQHALKIETVVNVYGYAASSDNLTQIPIPYASPTASNNIELSVSTSPDPNDKITITTGDDWSDYSAWVVLEYLKI